MTAINKSFFPSKTRCIPSDKIDINPVFAIPVNIAFMPILIPPLIYMMNRMKIDRRAVACALCWGNRAPYLFLPVGYGLIFHHLIAGNMTKYGMPMETMEIWKAMIFPAGIGMLLGLLFAVLVLYRKPREYKEIIIAGADAGNKVEGKMF